MEVGKHTLTEELPCQPRRGRAPVEVHRMWERIPFGGGLVAEVEQPLASDGDKQHVKTGG
jgi:hypothetical protein